MATRIGLEPTTPSVTGWCSNQLSYRAILEQLLLLRYGAADEARTRYLHLGKVALYQMSYGRRMCILCEEYTRNDASDRNRTNDTGIFSPLLYRLSYRGISGAIIPAPSRAILANLGAPAKACEARFCGEEEKFQSLLRRSYL